jgi:adenine-specific DNA-methyltransferase
MPVEEVFQKDAFQFLSGLPEGSVDLVISSPPYCMAKAYDTSCEVGDFIASHDNLFQHLLRVVKDGGSVCWQVGHHVRNNVVVPLDAIVYSAFAKSGEFRLRNRLVWTFGHGAHSPRRFSGRHETVLWFTKGDNYHFDLDAVRVPQKYPGKKHYKGPKKGKPSGNPLGKNPGDVWEIPNVKFNHVEKTDHPCQFPVALAQRLVRALSAPGALVIDPYLGSGSTAVAAIAEGRRFAGCDIEPKYVKIARERISSLKSGTLKIRPLDQPIYVPGGNDTVARRPVQWLQEDFAVS